MIDIDFEAYFSKLTFKIDAQRTYLFDPVRRKYLVAEQEEVVRQMLILYFTEEKQYPLSKLAVEKVVKVNGMRRRFDLLVYDRQTNPFLLVECKSPKVEIDDSVFRQISMYNLSLRVPYLLVTDGRITKCCAIEYESRNYRFLNEVPDYPPV